MFDQVKSFQVGNIYKERKLFPNKCTNILSNNVHLVLATPLRLFPEAETSKTQIKPS